MSKPARNDNGFMRSVGLPLLVTFIVLAVFVAAITFFSGVFDWVVYVLMDLG